MNDGKTILVLGSRGLLGRALCNASTSDACPQWRVFGDCDAGMDGFPAPYQRPDLSNPQTVYDLLVRTKPRAVINCAARVRGVYGNKDEQAEQLSVNLALGLSINHACYTYFRERVRNGAPGGRVLNIGSACMYPAGPLDGAKEDDLYSLNNHNRIPDLEPDTYGYALAKRTLLEQAHSLNQAIWNSGDGPELFRTVIPCNIFGSERLFNEPGDLLHGPGDVHTVYRKGRHVIPAMLRDLVLLAGSVPEGAEPKTFRVRSPKAVRQFAHAEQLAFDLLRIVSHENNAAWNEFPEACNYGGRWDGGRSKGNTSVGYLASMLLGGINSTRTLGTLAPIMLDETQSRFDGRCSQVLDDGLFRTWAWEHGIDLSAGPQVGNGLLGTLRNLAVEAVEEHRRMQILRAATPPLPRAVKGGAA